MKWNQLPDMAHPAGQGSRASWQSSCAAKLADLKYRAECAPIAEARQLVMCLAILVYMIPIALWALFTAAPGTGLRLE